MDLRFSPEDEAFRGEARRWLERELDGDFAPLRGRGGPGDEHALVEGRRAWERHLGAAGWIGLGWPAPDGRGAPLWHQVIWAEEYARAGGPGRLGHIGEQLVGPTLCAFGTAAQKQRFLGAIRAGQELWCQGYSEPNAGSDLAGVQTRAELVGDEWVISGQKTWTSLAHLADWCFVLARTDPSAPRHRGLSYLLVSMRQPGIEVRPIAQMTGSSEFSEVFFDGARAPRDHVVGEPGAGWRVAMATLAFERGVSTLGQQIGFEAELDAVLAAARGSGATRDPALRQRLVQAWIGLRIMKWNALRTLSRVEGNELGREALINKLYWSHWHQALGKLALDVQGLDGELTGPDEPTPLQRLFLFSRADTIYAGTSEIQRNLIAERGLGMPVEPRR